MPGQSPCPWGAGGIQQGSKARGFAKAKQSQAISRRLTSPQQLVCSPPQAIRTVPSPLGERAAVVKGKHKDSPRLAGSGGQCLLVPGEMPGPWRGGGRRALPTLNTKMRRIPGMEAILISHRQPMVGFTTDARPMINKDPANQNTFPRERKGLKHEHMATICLFFPLLVWFRG